MRFLSVILAVPALAAASSPSQLMDRIPAWFEPNAGQWKSDVRFASRSANGSLRISATGAQFALPGGAQIGFRLEGANPTAPLEGRNGSGVKSQYFIGRGSSNWKSVPQYSQVAQAGVYPGIDLVYYSAGKHLEYDFVVKPGADPARIRMRFPGAQSHRLDAEGNLILGTGSDEVKHLKPFVYQGEGTRRVEVAGSYRLAKNGEVRFILGAYDRSKPLVIDPVLTYAGYLGGAEIDTVNAAAVDSGGNLWLTGGTTSQIDIPVGITPLQTTNAGEMDAYLARISTVGDTPQLTYYAYFGGASSEEGTALTIDQNGYIWVAGYTNSVSFPLGGDAYQIQGAGDYDIFVSQFRPDQEGASSLFYSTYYGGTGRDVALAIATDGTNAIVTGYTNSGELPKITDYDRLQPSNRGGYDAVILRFEPYAGVADNTLAYATFLGGDGTDLANAVVIEPSGTVLVTGFSASNDFPLAGASYQSAQYGRGDIFFTRLDTTKGGFEALIYSTYLGGNDSDSAYAMRLEPNGEVWICGYTLSTDFPVTPDAAQIVPAGGADAFLARINLAEANIVKYSTYYGGSGTDLAANLLKDPQGRIVLGGYTTSKDFPAIGTDPKPGAGTASDAFVAVIDPAISGADSRRFSTTFGGAAVESAGGLGIDADGNIFVAGSSTSTNLPVTTGGAKPSVGGIRSGYFVRIAP